MIFTFRFSDDDDYSSPNPISALTLRFERHEYGANLTTALLSAQLDSEVNHQHEDRFRISGLHSVGRPVHGISAQKAAGRAILTDLFATIFPNGSRPVILDLIIPYRYPPTGPLGLPPIIIKFVNPTVATAVRLALFKHVRNSALPALRSIWIEPVLTPATSVRIEILQAIRRILSMNQIRCSIQRFSRAPLIHVATGDRERVYHFVPACQAFGHMLSPEDLTYAYRAAGRKFKDRLTATFLVLTDGAQPAARFNIPPPQGSLNLAQSALTPLASTSASTIVSQPPIPYLQRMLTAPVVSNSGRKRPAETSTSELAPSVSGKRSAP